MNRRKSREVAMQLLYSLAISENDINDTIEVYKRSCEESIEEIDFSYVEKLMKGVTDKIEDLDNKIKENLKGWTIQRISNMSLTVLRIATYEIFYLEDVPDKVAVNEAIELSKEFCEDKAPQFINGVLNNFVTK